MSIKFRNMKKLVSTGMIFYCFLTIGFTQVGVGTNSPDSSAILDVSSTSKGFLPPRMTNTERDAIVNPQEGLQIYNSTTDCLEFYVNGSWRSIRCGNTYLLSVSSAGPGTGTITSAPGGIDCGVDCSENIMDGTMVVLTATPSGNSIFAGWSGGGCSGTGQCAVSMTAAQSVVATFIINSYLLTISKSGNGSGEITSAPAGINCGVDCSENYNHGTSVTLTATPSPGSAFLGWSGGGCSGTGNCNVTMFNAANVTATFTRNTYVITSLLGGSGSGTVVSTPPGIYCGVACQYIYDYGTSITLTASPSNGSSFTGWSGGSCSGSAPTCNFTITGPQTVNAQFTLNSYALNVSKTGTGTGVVTSSPSGINCGIDCTENYAHGTMVTLTAAPSIGSTFTGWSGAGCTGTGTCTVTMNNAQSVVATFITNSYLLTISKTGNGSGEITSAPAGINCGVDCSENYNHGTLVTLTATPSPGSTFLGWTGGGCSGTGNCDVTMSSAQNVTALFQLPTYPLDVTLTGTGSQDAVVYSSPEGIYCGVDCSETYNYGSIVTLTAVSPAQDIIFAGWSGGGCSGTGPCAVSMTATQSVVATFNFNSYALTVTRAGTGTGTVTSAPAGINCGTDCDENYTTGTVVTLTATPAATSYFSGWSGGGCSGTGNCNVTMDNVKNVTAQFETLSYSVTTSSTGAGSGVITSSPTGIYCGYTCATTFNAGTLVTLTASPVNGSNFAGWSGSGCSGTGNCVLTMNSPNNVQATFNLNTYQLSVTKTGSGNGDVTSSPAGINCGTDCMENYAHGTMVTLTATPSIGSTFTGWSGSGCTGTGTCTVTMNNAQSVVATFITNSYPLTITRSGNGSGEITSAPAGINCGVDCGENYNHGTLVTLTATPSPGSTFTGWSGGGCSGTGDCNVTMNSAQNVTATFTRNTYVITSELGGSGSGIVVSSPPGIYCGAACQYIYDYGTSITMYASPSTGSSFTGWSGGSCSGSIPTCNFTITGSQNINAQFTLNSYALNVTKTGTGTGVVTSSPSGINCGMDCTENYTHGSMVTLTAAPSIGSTFTGWSGAGCTGTGTCTVTMNNAQSVVATFITNSYPLTVNLSGNGSGEITSAPGGISCGSDCSQNYDHGTLLTLWATTFPGSDFLGWTGGGCSGTGNCNITMSSAQNVTAVFQLQTYPLTVTLAGTGSQFQVVYSSPLGIYCGGDCSETYNHGMIVELTAALIGGASFDGWAGGGCSGTGPCFVTMTSAQNVTATYTIQ